MHQGKASKSKKKNSKEIFYFILFLFLFFDKFLKLLGRSQAVDADGLATSPSNLKCIKENRNLFFCL
jgi:hypothetical protein